jgi:hypothetical protein
MPERFNSGVVIKKLECASLFWRTRKHPVSLRPQPWITHHEQLMMPVRVRTKLISSWEGRTYVIPATGQTSKEAGCPLPIELVSLVTPPQKPVIRMLVTNHSCVFRNQRRGGRCYRRRGRSRVSHRSTQRRKVGRDLHRVTARPRCVPHLAHQIQDRRKPHQFRSGRLPRLELMNQTSSQFVLGPKR